jgi:CBS-domain-containing membrane protein
MKARDIMTTDVVTVGPETPVREVAVQLFVRRISAVPVVDAERRVLGIVSEGDLMRRAEAGTERRPSWWLEVFSDWEGLAQDYLKSHGRTAADVMTRYVVSVTDDAEVGHIVDLLESRGIKRVPVVREGRLVGIVSRADLLRGLITGSAGALGQPAEDRKIHEALMSRIRSEPWASLLFLNVLVRDGAVELWGIAKSEEQREALRVLAESVPGVGAVRNSVRVMPRNFVDS